MTEPPTDDELQDLLDGRLRGPRLLAVLAHLRDHPDLAEHVQELRRTDAALRELARPADRGGQRRLRGGRVARALIPAAGLVAAVLLAVWWLAGAPWPDVTASTQRASVAGLADRATTAHHHLARVGRPGVDFRADAVDAFWTWSAQAFGTGIMPPDLSDLGYTFAGARVLPTHGQPASVLAYERPDGLMITVYCWTPVAPAGQGLTHVRRNGYHVGVGQEPHLGVAVVAPRRVDDFAAIAATVLRALDTADPGARWPTASGP
ncbi:Transmembrane transcriptional regulator (anti-sigma factor RsiW) [Limimonas halophila]|uniref:Transmembrane transcriptional regulator (Anti-sigma factor RsiW) n=1 Tax=Limimonas halophila TaxID=1082479 RepID=A0A1G7LIE1_9PROT|nr:hypothetical protein [Limimonas halophila]SDF49213.1 Transmembrane transcriptional regulator (anti-sigma factor RsiW) [Limimonas halophila]